MNIPEEANKIAKEKSQAINELLAKRGFYDIDLVAGNAGGHLFYNKESASPLDDAMLPLLHSATSQDDFWNQIRRLGFVHPRM